jgi:hypothetical protein
VYAIDLQVTESVITGGKYTKIILGWTVSGSSLSDAAYYLLEVFDPDGNLIFSRQLPLDSLSYELTAEELALLDPNVNYTFSLRLIDSDGLSLTSEGRTSSKLIALPVTGGELEDTTVDTDETNTANTTILWLCCGLLLISLLALVIFLLLRKRKQRLESM